MHEVPPGAGSVPRGLKPEDFDTIREAVMETPRGRWFLDEYATRLRQRETAGIVESVKRLETAVASNHDALMSRLAETLKAEREPVYAPPVPAEPAPRIAPRHMKYFRDDEDVFEPAPEAMEAQIAALTDLAERARRAEEPATPPKRRIVIIRHKPGEQIEVPLADEFAKAS